MEIVNYTREEFEKLEKILLGGIFHGEGEIYKVGDVAIKRLYSSRGLYFSNKLYTINTLIDKKDSLFVDGMVFPEKLLTVDEEAVGFTMPYIEGKNLGSVLKDDKVDILVKIGLLKQVGQILEKMAEVRKENKISNYFLNDLHENNFIVDKNGLVHVIDLDSCSVYSNTPFGTKYVTILSPLKDFLSKYRLIEEYSCGGEFIPSLETDLYCYCIMILNLFSNTSVHRYSLESFREFLGKLKENGLSRDLFDIFNNIYSTESNVNPHLLLDGIEEPYLRLRKVK